MKSSTHARNFVAAQGFLAKHMVLAIAMGGISGVCSAGAISMVSKAVGGNATIGIGPFLGLTAIRSG